jgi:hypothetical protein
MRTPFEMGRKSFFAGNRHRPHQAGPHPGVWACPYGQWRRRLELTGLLVPAQSSDQAACTSAHTHYFGFNC